MSEVFTAGTAWIRRVTSGPIARASSASFLIRVVGIGLSFFQAILAARILGAAGYGTVAAVLSVVQILATVSVFGLGPLAVREIPKHQSRGTMDHLSGFLLKSLGVVMLLASGLAAAAMALIFGPVSGHRVDGNALLAAGGLVVFMAAIMLFAGWSRGFGRTVNGQVPNAILRPLVLVLILGSAYLSGRALSVADFLLIAGGASLLAMVVGGGWLWLGRLRDLPRPQSYPDIAGMGASSFPFLGLAVMAVVQGEILTILLSVMAGSEQAGLWQPVARLAPLLLLPVQAAAMRFGPRMAELHEAGKTDEMVGITRRFTTFTTAITAMMALVVAAGGPWILLAFGPQFPESAPLLWVIGGAQIFNAACGPVTILLSMTGHSKTALQGTVVGTVLVVMAGLALIPIYSTWGAAIAMVIGIAATNVIQTIAVRKRLAMRPNLLHI